MRVEDLWRFPVKSMQGEQLERVELDELGLVGDRRYAVVDLTTGMTLTARREPKLLFAQAKWGTDGAVTVVLPSGEQSADDESLSSWLGRPVSLRSPGDFVPTYEIAVDAEDEEGSPWVHWDGPVQTFHDSGTTQVSLVTGTTLRDWAARRFRMNVVLDGEGEDDLLGREVSLGTTRLEVVKGVVRCVMTTRPQPGGIERDLSVLRTITAERGGSLGIGALVRTPGSIAVGDELLVV
jgi:uncharacterized protein YcbX